MGGQKKLGMKKKVGMWGFSFMIDVKLCQPQGITAGELRITRGR
jgi:hypothetical protein